MDIETKLKLLDVVESYWDILPPEIKEYILEYKESQELIEWRESLVSQSTCVQIRDYGYLRRAWYIGPIQCKCYRVKACRCQPGCFYMKIYGHYWHLNGDRRQVFLHYDLHNAIPRCDSHRDRLWHQTNEAHTMNVIAYL